MKKLFLFLLLFPTLTLAAPKGIQMTYDVEASHEDRTTKSVVRYLFLEDRFRVETEVPDNPMGPVVILGHTKPKETFTLFPLRKTYMKHSPEMENWAKENASDAQNLFKPSGKTKTIAGHSCEILTRTQGKRKEETCVSKKLFQEFKLQSMMFSTPGEKQSMFPKGITGLPLEFISQEPGKGKGTRQVVRVRDVRKEKMDPKIFEVPAGYKKQDMPTPGKMNLEEAMKNAGQPMSPEAIKQLQKRMQGN